MNRQIAVCVAAFALAGAVVHGAEQPVEKRPSPYRLAPERLAEAERLYHDGSYEEARALVEESLEEVRQEVKLVTPKLDGVLARLHALAALLEYAFREDGFEARIDERLQQALEHDPYLDLGDPAEVPAFVQTRFRRLQADYLARFSRMERRTSLGITSALVLEPTVIDQPSILQPGLSYTFNLGEYVSLEAGIRFPLVWPPWNSIRGQVGLIYYPTFRVERVITGITFSYLFGLDVEEPEGATYMHSLAVGGRAEYLWRSGLGIAMHAELLRANIAIANGTLEPPEGTEINLLGLLNIVFPNLSLNVFWAF
jgi:hypothetical protein